MEIEIFAERDILARGVAVYVVRTTPEGERLVRDEHGDWNPSPAELERPAPTMFFRDDEAWKLLEALSGAFGSPGPIRALNEALTIERRRVDKLMAALIERGGN